MSSRDRPDGAIPLSISQMLGLIPFTRHLGIRLIEAGPAGETIFHLPFDTRVIGNLMLPAVHGGVLASFMEAAALTTVYAMENQDRLPKLVDFSIDYLSSAGPHDLYSTCEILRQGKRIAAVGIRCWQRDRNAPVTLGRAHILFAQPAAES